MFIFRFIDSILHRASVTLESREACPQSQVQTIITSRGGGPLCHHWNAGILAHINRLADYLTV